MNRKQKVAVVIGVVVIVLLVLFPIRTARIPLRPDEGRVTPGKDWVISDRPPTVILRWIGWKPPSAPRYAIYTREVPVDPRTSPYYDLLEDKDEYLKAHAEGRIPVLYENVQAQVRVEYGVSVLALVLSIATALALTLAAVLVLRDRKPSS